MPLDAAVTTFPPPSTASNGTDRELHRRLAAFNRARLDSAPGLDWLASIQAGYRMRRLEHDFVEAELATVRSAAREAPREPQHFARWFERLEQLAGGTNDVLFPWLAEAAEIEPLRWYLRQELAASAASHDLSALTRLKFAPRASWDVDDAERIAAANTQASLLRRVGQTLFAADAGGIVRESLAMSNLMVAFAANRRYAYHAAGALAAREHSARGRRAWIERALERARIHGESCSGYSCEVASAPSWGADVLTALVAHEPNAAYSIAEGALAALQTEARCFARYRRELMSPLEAPAPDSLPSPAVAGEAEYVLAN